MGDRPVGERAYGEGGQAGMYAGERGSGSAAEKREKLRADEGPGDACALQREKLRERGAELVFK